MREISIPLLFYCVLFGQTDRWTESLNYHAYFSGIHVAEAELKISEQQIGGKSSVIHILYQAKTISVTDYIFPINDKINIEVDSKTWTPISVKKVVREGKYKHDSFTQFLPEENIFIYKKDTISYAHPVHDPYSLIYLFRKKTLSPGNKFQLNTIDGRKITQLQFDVSSIETIRVPAGEFDALKVTPKRTDGKPFKNAGQLTIWYSTEIDKLPVKISIKLKFGSLNLELANVD
jgi:hypothetical protein